MRYELTPLALFSRYVAIAFFFILGIGVAYFLYRAPVALLKDADGHLSIMENRRTPEVVRMIGTVTSVDKNGSTLKISARDPYIKLGKIDLALSFDTPQSLTDIKSGETVVTHVYRGTQGALHARNISELIQPL